jgi:hypothetical protein
MSSSQVPLPVEADVESGATLPTGGPMEAPGAKRLEWINLILVLAGGAVTLIWQDWPLTWSFLAGGLLTTLNLRLLRLIVRSLTRPQGVKKWKLVAQVVVKYLGGLGALAVIMLVFHPRPVPFLLGLSTIVAAVVAEGIVGVFRSE